MFDNLAHMYKDFYYRLPQPVKNIAGNGYGKIPLHIRLGKRYSQHYQCAVEFSRMSDDRKLDFIFEKTKKTLTFAQTHIPYYKKLFSEAGFSHKSFQSFSDLKNIPPLTKDDIKAHLPNLYTKKFERAATYFTGGSTSVPMQYFHPLFESRAKEKAYLNYCFSACGYRYRDPTLLLKGRDIASGKADRYWDYEPVDNYLCLSSQHLNTSCINLMIEEATRFSPRFVFGYPSAVMDFIKACKGVGIHNLAGVKATFLASEKVYSEQLEFIEDFFNCTTLVHYGHSERCSFATKLSGQPFHFFGSYGLNLNIGGEIVTTSFDNHVMPFINYRTNDFFAGEVEYYSNSEVVKSCNDIEGRIQEYLVTKDGRLISICAMGAGHFSAIQSVGAIQYQQEIPGFARLIVESNAAHIDLVTIKRQLESHTDDSIQFDVETVAEIERSSRGKRIMCVQKLNIDQYR